MKQTKVTANLDGLEKFRREIGNSFVARVGIIGSQASQSHQLEKHGYKENRAQGETITNAELGLIQMYGSITNNIPPRDFLVMPIEMKRRELIKVLASSQSRTAFAKGNFKGIFAIMGAAAEGFIMEAFATGGFGSWAPNKSSTVRQKRSSAPLIDTGELRKSISSDVVNKSAAILSGSRSINVAV